MIDDDTIPLLLDEIARLEREIQERDACGREIDEARAVTGAPSSIADDGAASSNLRELEAELASRDETIELLLEHVRRLEEADAAKEAEWETLTAWVSEVENRLETRDDLALQRLQELCDQHLQRARDAELECAELRRRSAKANQELEQEVERLRTLLAGSSVAQEDQLEAAKDLQAENQRLRQTCRELEQSCRQDIEDRRIRAAETQDQIQRIEKELVQERDAHRRDQREAEAIVADLRSQLTRIAVEEAARARSAAMAVDAGSGRENREAVDVDLRIRAFRQHLAEVHLGEVEARESRRLSARLSRLWSRTGPQ